MFYFWRNVMTFFYLLFLQNWKFEKIFLITFNHSQRFVAIMCIKPNLANAACLVSFKFLLFRNIKCIWAMTRRSLAAGVIALNGPDAISAPICNPVNTNDPAPKPTVPSLKQKLPYCWAWRLWKRFLAACG